jgi:uncharacterized protein DUF2188
MANKENQLHVVSEGYGWKVDKNSINENPSKFSTQQRAIEEAMRLATNKQDMEIIIHNPDGKKEVNPSYL